MRLFVAAAVLLSSSIAAAQAPGQTLSWDAELPSPVLAPTPPQPVRVSYRLQILVADAASFTLMGFAPEDNPQLGTLGLAGYLLGSPLVHFAQGRSTAGVQSLALRGLMPIVGGLVGWKLGPGDHCLTYAGSQSDADSAEPYHHAHECDSGSVLGAVFGMLGGMATAMYIDYKHLAVYQKHVAPSWSASVKRTHGGFAVGLGRAF